MRLVSKLSGLMEKNKIDQKTLSIQTGLSPATVGKVYRGRFDRIDNHTVTALCLFFRLKTISELIEIEWEPGDK